MGLTGDRIRELRQQHGMTLDDVAKNLGVNRQAVHKYEQGLVTNIPLDKVEKMADMFGVSPGYISGWTDSPEGAASDKCALTDVERSLISLYRSLSPRGQQLLMDRAEELKLLYGKKSEGSSTLPLQKP